MTTAQFLSVIFFLMTTEVSSNYNVGKELYDKLMRYGDYSHLIRPVDNETDKVVVMLGVRLYQLLEVDEQNQFMTVNVWLVQEWFDPALQWDPSEYENMTMIHVPSASIWHPEIVLYNNADGGYEMTSGTKAQVMWNGLVKWTPPATLKSSCPMNVKYFPFDEQTCEMKFGSWTYNSNEVHIIHKWQNKTGVEEYEVMDCGIDMKDFLGTVEWDMLGVTAYKSQIHYAGSVEPFDEWTFTVTIRRKFLFYTVNLIIPLVSHVLLTILVFYLPSGSKQKIPLCITILLSLTVYFLMLAEIIPPTSLVVPLLAEYLLFTLILVTFSVVITALTLNVHFRSAATHVMPNWIRKIFLYFLPRLLMMRRPKIENSHDVELKNIKLHLCTCFMAADGATSHDSAMRYQFGSKRTRTQTELMHLSRQLDSGLSQHDGLRRRNSNMSPKLGDAIDGAIFIANHLKQEDEFKRTKEDWKYVALVIDRMFLWLYSTVSAVGTVAIICQAPMLFDKKTFSEVDNICGFPQAT